MIKNSLLLGLSSLILVSCNFTANPTSLVGDYAQTRWDALIAGNLQKAYSFYTDTYKRTTPYEHFTHKVKGVGLWTKAKVLQVTCDKEQKSCEAEVNVTVAMRMRGLLEPTETSMIIKETWIKNGAFSDWRYVSR